MGNRMESGYQLMAHRPGCFQFSTQFTKPQTKLKYFFEILQKIFLYYKSTGDRDRSSGKFGAYEYFKS